MNSRLRFATLLSTAVVAGFSRLSAETKTVEDWTNWPSPLVTLTAAAQRAAP